LIVTDLLELARENGYRPIAEKLRLYQGERKADGSVIVRVIPRRSDRQPSPAILLDIAGKLLP
jgi:hypothetical protein